MARKKCKKHKKHAPRTLVEGKVPEKGTPEYKAHRIVIMRRCFARNRGMTLEEYNLMHENHSGLCDICGLPPHSGKREYKRLHLDLDHCHRTNKNRGLLCSNCNLGLGNFKDDPRLLAIAIDYLEEHS